MINMVANTSGIIALAILSVSAFILSMLLTPLYTYFAYRFKFWKRKRETATTGEKLTVFAKQQAEKLERNIPTMAGIIFLVAVTIITFFFNLDRRETWLPLAAFVGGGIVGLIDDVINVFGNDKGVAGLRSSIKFALIFAMGAILGWYFFAKLGYHAIHVPYLGMIELGWLVIPVFAFIVVATGNAVNISDGLDGLAGGLATIAYTAFGTIATIQGQLHIAVFCFVMVGALLAYLWFNIYPARFFMGDVGSFAIGTSLGVVCMLTDTMFILPIIGVIFVVEAGSSLIQIFSKKVFKRKIFISAPIHHHIQALGWPEVKITMRFWVIGAISALIGILVAVTGTVGQ